MSAGGFIAQALLGGTQGAAQGIGNKIREEAKLKRQQALEETRTEKRMQEQAHGSALAIGQQNLQNEYASEQSRLRRKHERELAEAEYKQRKGLVDYKLSAEQRAARESGEYKIDPRTEIQIDEVRSNLEHLRKLETNLRSKSTDSFGNVMGGSTEEGGLTVEEINSRTQKETEKLNILLGNKKPTNADNSLLKMAMNTPVEDRTEFVESLKGDERAAPELIKAVEALYSIESQQAQPAPSPQPQQQGQGAAPPEQPPQDQSQGGMISQANATPPVRDQGPQPTADERPGANPRPPADPNAGKPIMEKQLGPMIEQGVREAGKFRDRMTEKQRQFSLQQLQEIAVRDGSKLSPMAKAQILQAHGRAIKDAPPEVIEQLKAIFGADEIEQYLN